MAPLNSYRIEGEEDDISSHHLQLSPEPLVPHSFEEAPPLERQRSTEVIDFVESVFDEMDSVLLSRQAPAHHQHPQPAVPAPVPATFAPAAQQQPMHFYRLSGEEQAWLDQEFDSEMGIDISPGGLDEASRTGSVDDRADDMDDETEEEFVHDLLVAHPAVTADEARWLWQERARAAQG